MHLVVCKYDDLGMIEVWNSCYFKIIFYRSICRFTLEKKHIHASSAYQNNVYIINLICIPVRWFALRKTCIQTGSTHGSNIYLIKYVLVAFVFCCSVLGYCLGFGYCILMTTFWMIILMEWLIDSIVVGSKGVLLMQKYLMIEWCCWWIWSENLWNVVPGRK